MERGVVYVCVRVCECVCLVGCVCVWVGGGAGGEEVLDVFIYPCVNTSRKIIHNG